jgi:flagellar biosynthesis/type III secretory pathway chaperone
VVIEQRVRRPEGTGGASQAVLLERLRDVLEQEAQAIEHADSESLRTLVGERGRLLAGLGQIAPEHRRTAAELEAQRARNEAAALARLSEIGARLRALAERRAAG